MSTGHLKELPEKPAAELWAILGQGDTGTLFARPVKVDHTCTISYTGGNSVDGAIVYIDDEFYRAVMSSECSVKGMTSRQIIEAVIEHEHGEWAIESGSNEADVYQPAHELATALEHHYVRRLGVDPDQYEKALKPFIERAARRPQTKPPRDLWCGPVIDHATRADKEVIRQFRAHGVEDAFKRSKFDVHYTLGEEQCRHCAMFGDRDVLPSLRKCDEVCGLVRAVKWCDKFSPRKGYGNGTKRS